MLGMLLRIGILTVLYLAILPNPQLVDLLLGIILSLLLIGIREMVYPPEWLTRSSNVKRVLQRLSGVPALLIGTVIDTARGSWQVAGYCLGILPLREPGVVNIRIDSRTQSSVTAWGIRVGINPDSVVVDVDEERGQLLVHVLDAHDPEAVRAEQLKTYRQRQRRVFP